MRHDPQRFMGKTVAVPHFGNRDTVGFASRVRDESNPGIKTLPPFLKKDAERAIWRISRFHGGLGCLPIGFIREFQ